MRRTRDLMFELRDSQDRPFLSCPVPGRLGAEIPAGRYRVMLFRPSTRVGYGRSRFGWFILEGDGTPGRMVMYAEKVG